MYVLDASVVLKWFLKEKDSDLALGFRQKYISGNYNLALPDLILYEISNALRYEKSFSSAAVYDSVTALIDLGIDIIIPSPLLIKKALEIAYANKITFYDAVYVALASEIGFEFVTADEKLFQKIKELNFVKLLSETTP